MKPNSGLVAALLMMFSVKSIADIAVEQYDHRVANKLAESMTAEASSVVCELTKAADSRKTFVHLSADSVEWEEAGFGIMTEEERMVFRRLYEHYGRQVAFTEDGLVIFPMRPQPKLDPVTVKAIKWVDVTPPQVIKKVLQFSA